MTTDSDTRVPGDLPEPDGPPAAGAAPLGSGTTTSAGSGAAVVTEPQVDDADDDGSGIGSGARALVDWIIVVAVALTVAFLVRGFVLAHFVVDGSSMDSTLHSGDRVFVNKLSYRLHDPNRGDVVVLHQISGASERDLIKRVIALPGETIEMQDCEVTIIEVDDTEPRVLVEPYLDPEVVGRGCGGDIEPLVVPENHVFVMGDNRGGSQDSRQLGPISEDDLVGRAFVVFWPRSSWQWL